MSEKTFKLVEIFKMDKDEAELDMIKACKQLVRKYGDFLSIEAKYSENIYYSTDKYSIKSHDKEIFAMNVRYREDYSSFTYELQVNDYMFHVLAGHKRKAACRTLHKMLKRKAEKQKNMISLRDKAVQKLNNSVQFIKQNVK